MAGLESPCTKICVIETAAGLCLGCGRSLFEIERWAGTPAQERARVMAELPQRLARLSAKRSISTQRP
jgi:predicted Fe-S protein YdhL (DUF1289 family)